MAVRGGDPSLEILQDARESLTDLIVLASTCYGEQAAVPDRVPGGARCPVLFVGPQALANLQRPALPRQQPRRPNQPPPEDNPQCHSTSSSSGP